VFLVTLFLPLGSLTTVFFPRLRTHMMLRECNSTWRESNGVRQLTASVRARSKSQSMTFIQVLHRPPLVACAMRTNGNGWGSRAQRALHGKCTKVLRSDLLSTEGTLFAVGSEGRLR
jgi:hypothetical protein